jgi:hypothetical protein
MNWLVIINTTEGEWYKAVVVSTDEKTAIETAYDFAEREGFPVEEINAEIFDQHEHGDIADYEILN